MTEILFVCTANQFRSPLAAAYFARKLTESSAFADWKVSSAGTWTDKGRPVHPKAQAEAAKLGLDLRKHRTREVDAQMLDAADLIVVMESGHKEALECEFPVCKGRVILLGEAADDAHPDIPDPAETNFEESEAAANSIVACIDKGFGRLVKLALSR